MAVLWVVFPTVAGRSWTLLLALCNEGPEQATCCKQPVPLLLFFSWDDQAVR